MLYLNRRAGEAVIINHTIEVRVVEVRGRTVKLGFSFPGEASVLREEVFEAIRQANQAAAEGMRALPAIAPDGLMPGPARGLEGDG
jgi:carbon storage regulator